MKNNTQNRYLVVRPIWVDEYDNMTPVKTYPTYEAAFEVLCKFHDDDRCRPPFAIDKNELRIVWLETNFISRKFYYRNKA